ncbi:MAG: iron-sulfur cluster assembly scaffold protein [Chloroflexi bacterium]|nr:iron-sulfur cluster assembly scaffold protein [Chloroflexota bacterium]
MYSDIVLEHFTNPRNVGTMEDPDGYGKVGSPVCGDLMEVYLRIAEGRITDIKFRTFGCGAAIASSSMASEMIKGRTLDEANALTDDKVAEELGGLPEAKMHCSNLAASAIQAAIADYYERHPDAQGAPRAEQAPSG